MNPFGIFFTNWGRKGCFGGPFSINESMPNGSLVNAEFSGPFDYSLPLAIEFDKHVAGSIPGLNASSGPPDIPRLIVSLIVDSIDRMVFGRSHANSFKKKRERIQEFLTNFYAASSVSSVLFVSRRITSEFHISPREFFFFIPSSVGHTEEYTIN